MNRAFDRVHTVNITYRTVQSMSNVRAVRESTYEIRVDGQVFVGVYEKQNVTNVRLEIRKKSAGREPNFMPNIRGQTHTEYG